MMTDKASVATSEGVFEASSGEVLTDVADLTDRLRRGADDLHMGLTRKKKPRFSPLGEGILESELVRLPMLLSGQSENAMSNPVATNTVTLRLGVLGSPNPSP
jgi:hypothetical protein